MDARPQASSKVVTDVADLNLHVGAQLGPSREIVIDQAMLDGFGQITGDRHWSHTDVERARRELPWKAPIAHGYLLIALITDLLGDMLEIRFKRALNYGLNRVRFTNVVPAGSRVRLFARVVQTEPVDNGGVRTTIECRMEIADAERPAFVAETVAIFYP
jgi:acyl dehydratase